MIAAHAHEIAKRDERIAWLENENVRLGGIVRQQADMLISHTALRGLECETCHRVAYDEGGGRACYSGQDGPGERCGTMFPVWLRVTSVGYRS